MSKLTVSCAADNDLYRVLQSHGFDCIRKDAAADAITAAPEGSAVLLLARDYPHSPTLLSSEIFELARTRGLRLFVEFPATLPDRPVGNIRAAEVERVVACNDWFGPNLPRLSVLMAHDAKLVEVTADESYLALARVAGFETAVYGLPECDVYPILFEIDKPKMLVATTRLSQFITSRFAPRKSWEHVWHKILSWLMPSEIIPDISWTPTLTTAFGPDAPLPPGAAEAASRRGAQWFINARMFNDPQWTLTNNVVGDGSHGVFEGIRSKIMADGTQPYATAFRNDCCSEVAMALAVRAGLAGEQRYAGTAVNILNFIFGPTGFQLEPCDDPSSPTYGLLSWSNGSREIYFGDDNARSIMGMMATAAMLKDERWNERITRAILANFRMSGPSACQGHNLWEPLLFKFGWEHFWEKDEPRLAPHFESWLLACFLWLYRQTGFAPLLERTRRGIGRMMQAYPHEWRWANGLQQERARMLLPLAWLVRVDDTPEHRAWLHRIADDLLAAQDSSGAIREELGDPGHGMYGPPKTNAAYGTNEAPLIHHNGEPVADLLYTSNFALVSLTEAAAATGDAGLERAAARLADFIIRVQIHAPTLPRLNGGWFRAFDYKRWEHWGASADGGWGPWCIETGWTQAWIITMLALRDRKTSFWDATIIPGIARAMEKVRPEMIPDRVLARTSEESSANGKRPHLHVEVGHDDLWTCYVGRDLETTLDLKKSMCITSLGATCAYAPTRGLKLPDRLEFMVSTDGHEFKLVGTAKANGKTGAHMSSHTLSSRVAAIEARYVKIRAFREAPSKNKAPASPPAPPAAVQMPGGPSSKQWLFIDEVVVECD